MANKNFNTRIMNKHDTEENWSKATGFIPLEGEVVIYESDETHITPRLKIGDGKTNVNNLPFINETIIDQTYSLTSENAQSGKAVAEAVKNKQDKLTAGTNITIDENNVINATNSGGACVPKKVAEPGAPFPSVIATSNSSYDENFIPTDDSYISINAIGDELGKDINNNDAFINSIPRRDSKGNLFTGTPVDNEDCVNKKYVDDALAQSGGGSTLNIKDSIGSSSLQQIQDKGYTGIAIKTKNPNAYALDSTLTDNEPIGATGDFAASFGGVTSAQGKRSFACGTNTIAKGKYSFASGDNAVALGNESFVSGYNTVAKGSQSFAIGSVTQAIGQNSVSTGSNNISNGGNSFTGGQDCVTSEIALRSFAYGKGLKTTSNDQFVIGMYNVGNKDNIFEIGYGYSDTNRQNIFYVTKEGFAYIQNSVIMSEADFVKQMSAYYGLGKGLQGGVQGSNCLASNTTDTAFGNNTRATAGASMATGVETQANGLHSFAGGNNSIAGYANQFIVGKFNSNKPDTYFEVGNGADDSNRSNAFEVYTDGHAEISAMGSTEKSVTTKKYVDDKIAAIPGGGGETVDQTYNPESENAQSGKAVAEAVSSKADIIEVNQIKDDIAYKLDYKNPQKLTADQQLAIQSAIGILSVKEVLF